MGLLRLASNLIFAYILISIVGSIWLNHKSYEFRVKEVMEVGQSWSGSFKLIAFPVGIRKQLGENHANVLTEEEFSPMYISTGGLRGSIHLLYTSLSEFLAVYHTPFKMTGETGRHFINMTITVLQGKVRIWDEKNGAVIDRLASAQYTHRIGERSFVEIAEDTYLLIYGRGLIPLTMGYWVCDSIFSSLDLASAVQTLTYYTRAVYSSLDFFEYFSSWWQAIHNALFDTVQLVFDTFRNILQGKAIMSDS